MPDIYIMTKYPILVKVFPEHCSVSTIHPISLKFIKSGVTVLNKAIFMPLSPNSLSLPALQCTVSPLSSPSTVFTAFTAAFYTVEPRSYQHRDKSLQCHLILSNFLLPLIFCESPPCSAFFGDFFFL